MSTNQFTKKQTSGYKKRALPFFIEFVKFSTGFVAILAVALFALQVANTFA